MKEKSKEQKLRKELRKEDYMLKKSRVKNMNAENQGGYMIIHKHTNSVAYGNQFELSLEDVEIFVNEVKEIPEKSTVWEFHNDEVVKLPKDFEKLGESENCKIQAMKHKSKPLFGLQFHPEVEHTEFGGKIFKNFVEICEK